MTSIITPTTADFKRCFAEDPLKDIRLGHFVAPTAGVNKGFFSTCNHETRFQILAPKETGMSAAELEAYFSADMKRRSKSFKHDMLYPARGVVFSGMPLYASLPVKGVFDNAAGVRPNGFDAAEYCLLAETQSGEIAAFLEAKFTLCSWHETESEEEEEIEAMFHLTLERVYTCSRFRGQGAFSFLVSSLATSYAQELTYLDCQVFQASAAIGRPVKVSLTVMADLESRSGYLAAHQLCDELESTGELMQEDGKLRNLKLTRVYREVGF